MSNFSFTKIDVPAAAGTYAYISADGVDAAGEAVGNYGNVDGEGDGTFDGFVTEGSSGITYNPPGSTNTDVVGITSSGEIFGDYVDNVLHQHGFVDNAGVVTKVDVLLANSTTVDGVNDSGVIYGEFADSSNHVHGFVDTNGSYTQIDVPGSSSSSVVGVNASGQIAGTYTDASYVVHGFVENGGGFTTIDPAGSIFTSIVGIDDAGIVVGNYQDSANNLHGFVDTNGVITTISIAGATSTSIQAINAAGEIVGYYTDGSGNVHGFVDQGGAVATVDVPGATETDIIGVSATGEITGYFNDANGQHGFVGEAATTVIQTDGTTSLTEVGNNYYLDVGGTGVELKYGGAPVTDGEFGAWTPIGAIQVANGYDVAWTLPGGNLYSVWNTDANGNTVSVPVSAVPGSNATLESLETIFHQDLNGDGVIDTASTVIEATGNIELTLSHMTQAATIDAAAKLELNGADSGSVTFNSATGSLILDHSSGFSGEVFNFTGDGNPSGSDQLDLKDIAFAAGTTVSYTGTSSGGTLTVSDAENHTAHIALSGDYTSSTFSLSSDGSGGTDVIDPAAKQDAADGTLSFGEAASTDQQTVDITPQNGGAGYLGNFIVDAANTANGLDSVGWHFNFDSSLPAKTTTQSYDVAVTDHHADGTHSSATQSVSVTIAGPGNDAFVFHPGVGSETIVNAANADTIELDGFSSVTNSNQLAQLLHDAQTGQSQSLFTAANGGHDTVINLDNHDSITLTNVHLADLHASNFIIH